MNMVTKTNQDEEMNMVTETSPKDVVETPKNK